MAIDIQPLSEKIGARATGVDLSRPLDDATFDRLHAAWLDAAVLAIPAQDAMTIEDHIAFSRRFGELDTDSLARNALAGHPEIFVVSNVTEDGKFVGARVSRSWHSDGQYLAEPTKASILHAREVPPAGGDTLFVNMAAVLDALPEATRRRIDGLRVVHSRVRTHPILFPSWAPLTEEEKARMPDAVHPLVRTHAPTGAAGIGAPPGSVESATDFIRRFRDRWVSRSAEVFQGRRPPETRARRRGSPLTESSGSH